MEKMLSVCSEDFKKYGIVINDLDLSDMIEAARKIPMPEKGVFYRPSIEELENTEGFRKLQDRFGGGCPVQAGMCWGYNEYMGGMEYHRSSEINVAVTDYVAALGDRRDLTDNTYDSRKAQIFYAKEGQVV